MEDIMVVEKEDIMVEDSTDTDMDMEKEDSMVKVKECGDKR